MYKSLLIIMTALGLAGCQFDQAILKPSAPGCSALANKIDHWLITEYQFQRADKKKRQAMLQQVAGQRDTVSQALLLSQPENSTAQLKKSLALFKALSLNAEPECDAEQYLQVRYQYTQSVMVLQRALNIADLERKQLRRESKKLQLQIEALTKIEQELSIQKEGEE